MASASGFQSIRIALNKIPNTQASGVWSGSSTKITQLDKGIYFCNWNVSYQVNGTGPITNSQTVVTSTQPYLSSGIVLASSPLTGAMGLSGTEPMRQTVTNTFIILQDNTPIYVYLSCTLTGQWGTTNISEQYLNYISFTRISSL